VAYNLTKSPVHGTKFVVVLSFKRNGTGSEKGHN